MKSFGMTDIGRKRKVNQDYLFFSDEPVGCFPNLYIVADGMGGHKAGDKASSYAVNRFVELARKETKELPFLVMERLLNEVNEEVYTLSCKEEQYSGMGTTFVAATVVDGTAYIMIIVNKLLFGARIYTNFHFSKEGSELKACLLYTSPSPRDKRQSRMPSSA